MTPNVPELIKRETRKTHNWSRYRRMMARRLNWNWQAKFHEFPIQWQREAEREAASDRPAQPLSLAPRGWSNPTPPAPEKKEVL